DHPVYQFPLSSPNTKRTYYHLLSPPNFSVPHFPNFSSYLHPASIPPRPPPTTSAPPTPSFTPASTSNPAPSAPIPTPSNPQAPSYAHVIPIFSLICSSSVTSSTPI